MGRRFWVLDEYEGIPICSGPYKATKFRQFLPAGIFTKTSHDGEDYVSSRPRSLVQIWTDHGLVTAAVACIWVKDPGKNSTPW